MSLEQKDESKDSFFCLFCFSGFWLPLSTHLVVYNNGKKYWKTFWALRALGRTRTLHAHTLILTRSTHTGIIKLDTITGQGGYTFWDRTIWSLGDSFLFCLANQGVRTGRLSVNQLRNDDVKTGARLPTSDRSVLSTAEDDGRRAMLSSFPTERSENIIGKRSVYHLWAWWVTFIILVGPKERSGLWQAKRSM